MVTTTTGLNLLGRSAIKQMGISLDRMLYHESIRHAPVRALTLEQDVPLQRACQQLCEEFAELFKPEMGCLKDFELEVRFKPDAKPSFCKPRAVPIALQEDLSHACDAGIAKGIWTPITFNCWGTPVVDVCKASLSGEIKAGIRVCGDYFVSVNSQLEAHRHPLPLPEELMRKLGGGHRFTKIDLADGCSQIKLCPESQEVGSQYTPWCAVTKRSTVRDFLGPRLLPKHYG